jgi:hypothetical protein
VNDDDPCDEPENAMPEFTEFAELEMPAVYPRQSPSVPVLAESDFPVLVLSLLAMVFSVPV